MGMADDADRYALRGGKWGYDRLILLSRDRWPDTKALFDRAGLGPGMKCVDLGCGGGEVTYEMARLVSPTGSVVGIDMDSVKLDLATKTAQERGVKNVVFRRMFVDDWNEANAYDANYCRFLLQHLKRPWEVLQKMWSALRPGGLLMVEDMDAEGWFSDPVNPGIDFLRERYIQLLERRGTDPKLGRRLFRQSVKLGIPDPQVALVSSVHTRDEYKTLPLTTLQASAEAMVAEGIASQREVDSALTSLENLVRDPNSLIAGPRVFQLFARKPTARA